MSDVLRQTDKTTGTPDDRAATRDERSGAPAGTGPTPETASGTAASPPMERPGGPDREPGDVMYGSGGMKETDEEDAALQDTDLERADMEAADPGGADLRADLRAADMEPAADVEPHADVETGRAYPGQDTETAGGTQPGPDMETGGTYRRSDMQTTGTRPGPGMETGGTYPGQDIETGRAQPEAEMRPGMESGMVPSGGPQRPPGSETVMDTGLMADAAQVHQRWQQIQATFVDDPRGSVERAATLADEVLGNVMTAGQHRVSDLRNAWDGNGNDTERLRNVLRRYRMFIDRLAGI